MLDQEILTTIQTFARAAFNDDTLNISPDTELPEDGFEELSARVTLIAALEREYRIKFDHNNVVWFRTAGDLARKVSSAISSCMDQEHEARSVHPFPDGSWLPC